MELKKTETDWICSSLQKFPFIRWDRFIEKNNPSVIGVYGWIDREKDQHKDFAYIEIDFRARYVFHVADSSPQYTDNIARICEKLTREASAEEYENPKCKRVEDFFQIYNSIKLNGGKRNSSQR